MKKKKPAEQPFCIHTSLGTLVVSFLDGTTINVSTVPGNPIRFFGNEWHVWLKMERVGDWRPMHQIGSTRQGVQRRDRSSLSPTAAKRVRAVVVAGVNQVADSREFQKQLIAADKRTKQKRLADLKAQKLTLESQLNDVQKQIDSLK